ENRRKAGAGRADVRFRKPFWGKDRESITFRTWLFLEQDYIAITEKVHSVRSRWVEDNGGSSRHRAPRVALLWAALVALVVAGLLAPLGTAGAQQECSPLDQLSGNCP